jgi:hypothetical protein
MPPAVFIDLGLEPLRHPRRGAVVAGVAAGTADPTSKLFDALGEGTEVLAQHDQENDGDGRLCEMVDHPLQ